MARKAAGREGGVHRNAPRFLFVVIIVHPADSRAVFGHKLNDHSELLRFPGLVRGSI